MDTRLAESVSVEAELAALVRPDRVHRRVYTDPAIFELEMERIFGRAWIYLGHDSMASGPGDYFLSAIGREPVIVVRGEDGAVHGLLNRCPHRGARICTAPHGTVKHFSCPYHAWTFRTDGALEAIPWRRGYGDSFDFADPAHAMTRVPRLASYRGFVFGSLAADGPDLETYLGPMAAAFANTADRSPSGRLEAVGTGFQREFAANWKIQIENALDLVHAGVVHESSIVSARRTSEILKPERESQVVQQCKANGLSLAECDRVPLHGYPGGHAYMEAFYRDTAIAPERQDPVFRRYRAALVERLGEEKVREVLGRTSFNNVIYPNVSINPLFQVIRVVQPVAVDRTIVRSTCFRLIGAPDEMFHQTISFLNTANSPAALISTDDFEIFARCQAGLASTRSEWIDLSRNIALDDHSADGAVHATGTSELALRTQFQGWLAHMTVVAA